jgi:hypothetical protein
MASLTLTRGGTPADILRRYKIILDDEMVGEINIKGKFELKLTPGRHTIYAKIDWCRSNKISFDVDSSSTIKFVCSNNVMGKNILVSPLFMTVYRNRYLKLEQINMLRIRSRS